VRALPVVGTVVAVRSCCGRAHSRRPVCPPDRSNVYSRSLCRLSAHQMRGRGRGMARETNIEKKVVDWISDVSDRIGADKVGNIAMRIGGRLPLRSQSHGKFILDGSSSSSGWHGFIPPRHNPMVVNPRARAASTPCSTFREFPLVLIAMATSPFRP